MIAKSFKLHTIATDAYRAANMLVDYRTDVTQDIVAHSSHIWMSHQMLLVWGHLLGFERWWEHRVTSLCSLCSESSLRSMLFCDHLYTCCAKHTLINVRDS